MRKGTTQSFLLRLPPDLYAAIRSMADQETRSINGEMVHLLRQAVARSGDALQSLQQGSPGRATTPQGQPSGA